MAKRKIENTPERPKLPTLDQVSAGGVVFRVGEGVEVAIISVGEPVRWQLPKGLVGARETPEAAALREVREETGIDAELMALIEKVEYWYVASRGGRRVRYHKFVHFYLLKYVSGDVRDHDWEVNEARWVAIDEAERMLAFKGEREVLAQARAMIEALNK